MRQHLFNLFFLLFILVSLSASAQRDSTEARSDRKDPRPFKDRLYFGGGLGLSFGSVTSIQVEPLVGYKIDQKNKWSAGLGISYWYFKDNRVSLPYETTVYGYRVFNRYRFIENLYGHVEYQQLSFELFNNFSDQLQRQWVPFLLVGGGYAAPLGGRTYLVAQVLWDVIQDQNSPYRRGDPFFSIGVAAGF